MRPPPSLNCVVVAFGLSLWTQPDDAAEPRFEVPVPGNRKLNRWDSAESSLESDGSPTFVLRGGAQLAPDASRIVLIVVYEAKSEADASDLRLAPLRALFCSWWVAAALAHAEAEAALLRMRSQAGGIAIVGASASSESAAGPLLDREAAALEGLCWADVRLAELRYALEKSEPREDRTELKKRAKRLAKLTAAADGRMAVAAAAGLGPGAAVRPAFSAAFTAQAAGLRLHLLEAVGIDPLDPGADEAAGLLPVLGVPRCMSSTSSSGPAQGGTSSPGTAVASRSREGAPRAPIPTQYFLGGGVFPPELVIAAFEGKTFEAVDGVVVSTVRPADGVAEPPVGAYM